MRWIVSFVGLSFLLAACNTPVENTASKRFTRLAPSKSGVTFRNDLKTSDDFNIIEYLYYYNGGGVAAGDINNDGLTDLYFSANQGSNRLYLNKGNLTFEDVTERSNTAGISGWKTGVCMADVNGDGWLDIFVAGVGGYKKFDGRNQLLLNNKDLTFSDRTEEFGLSFQGFSTAASFFDYDNDGDLDMYLVNHSVHTSRSLGSKSERFEHDPVAGDRLYRNELVPTGKVFFTDVTVEAGILNSRIAYGLSVAVSDLNNDGFQDIYVANDFHENDYLYINNQDGTFREVIETAMAHTSRFSMGTSAADLNEDGWNDIVSLDMRPREEQIIKTTQQDDNYDIYQYKLQFGYHHQYSRNTMQLSNGIDDNGNLLFTDVAAYAGVDATDWSWSPVVADFDNDGWKDLFVTNGILQRPNNLDYISYISTDSAQRFLSDAELASKMPTGKVSDIMFRNTSQVKFYDVTQEWMDAGPNISNGAVTADLDNDGDLEIIVNSLNDDAVIWKNNSESANYIRVKLVGEAPNTFGIGTKVVVSTNGHSIYLEQQPVRGWESSSEPVLHAGLGASTVIDSLTVIWPNGKFEIRTGVQANQVVTLDQAQATSTWSYEKPKRRKLLEPVSLKGFTHLENPFNPFEQEPLLTHAFSMQGPCVAVADFNGDNLDDYFIGGAADQPGAVYFQTLSGDFGTTRQTAFEDDQASEDTSVAAADVNGDGFIDLVVGSGGHQHTEPDPKLLPRVYINNGKGQFKRQKEGMPTIPVNTSCVTSADIDGDGDQDLFIGGQVASKMYGVDLRSYVLINNGKGIFTDKTQNWLAEPFQGMVSDATWADINKDSRPDLILVGEWMPVKIMINDGTRLSDRTAEYGLADVTGMWSSVAVADMDNDGDLDILGGNMGMNSRLTASSNQPLELYAGDIDRNFSLDHVITYYNRGTRHPFISRDLLVKQVPPLKRKFLRYADFGSVKLEDIIQPSQQSLHKTITTLASVYLENDGLGKFFVHQLPKEAQYSTIHSILPVDVNKDGNHDILLVGNLDAVQPDIGRFDGSYGLILTGDGKGNFTAQPVSSGFVVKGQGRDIKAVKNAKGQTIYIVARNNDSVLYFK